MGKGTNEGFLWEWVGGRIDEGRGTCMIFLFVWTGCDSHEVEMPLERGLWAKKLLLFKAAMPGGARVPLV